MMLAVSTVFRNLKLSSAFAAASVRYVVTNSPKMVELNTPFGPKVASPAATSYLTSTFEKSWSDVATGMFGMSVLKYGRLAI